MSDHQHERVTTRIMQADGSTQIETKSYYEQLAYNLIEIEKHIPCSKQTILKEIINCLELMTRDHSHEINIRIKGKNGEPFELTKRWVTVKESFNRQ